jgi:hypothetical protein
VLTRILWQMHRPLQPCQTSELSLPSIGRYGMQNGRTRVQHENPNNHALGLTIRPDRRRPKRLNMVAVLLRRMSPLLAQMGPRPLSALWSSSGGLCCKTPLLFSAGPICVLLSLWRSPLIASCGIIGLHAWQTGYAVQCDCGRWRRAAEELDEAPQVLSGCGQ